MVHPNSFCPHSTLTTIVFTEATTWEISLTAQEGTTNLFKTKLVQRGEEGLWEIPLNNKLFEQKGLLDATVLHLTTINAKWSKEHNESKPLFLLINNHHKWTVDSTLIYINVGTLSLWATAAGQ
jgi:hypothetical protein